MEHVLHHHGDTGYSLSSGNALRRSSTPHITVFPVAIKFPDLWNPGVFVAVVLSRKGKKETFRVGGRGCGFKMALSSRKCDRLFDSHLYKVSKIEYLT